MRMRKKKWVDPFIEENKEYIIDNFNELDTDLPIYLEIGMGMGDFITQSAKYNPNIFYLGLEKDVMCIGRTIKKIIDLDLKNIKLMFINADKINEIFPNKCIDVIYLHFSDPWPKKGHHKRRLTYNSFLKVYKDKLKDDGRIIFKTDNDEFFNDSLEYFKEEGYELIIIDRDFRKEPKEIPMTGYELKFSSNGKNINYAEFKK